MTFCQSFFVSKICFVNKIEGSEGQAHRKLMEAMNSFIVEPLDNLPYNNDIEVTDRVWDAVIGKICRNERVI